jgi:hypothetical protein
MTAKDKKEKNTELEQPTIHEIEHETVHPGIQQSYDLQENTYASGENDYLNERPQG